MEPRQQTTPGTSKTITLMGLIIITLQLIFDTLNSLHLNLGARDWVSGGIIIMGIFVSVFNQIRDSKIPNSKIWPTIVFAAIAVAMGILDKLDLLPLQDDWKIAIRTTLSIIINVIPMWLKALFPDDYNNNPFKRA